MRSIVHTTAGYLTGVATTTKLIFDVKAADVPPLIERLLKAYLAGRSSKDETFLAFTRRHDDAALKAMLEPERVS